ncbi:hypothetical protein A0257_22850 (plasmid) [Hymenobacter psoromatis]|nr:hypothetical protein A0257_22850 [Hymenobacter psoromatis]
MFTSLHKRLLTAAALLLTATGCEKVLDLPLKTSPVNIVIEGNLVDDNRPAQVRLTTSVNYKQANAYPPVTGAVVTLSDNAGSLEVLRETSPGQYVGATLRGVPGRVYTLRVETGGAAYVAVSTLPAVVPFEEVHTEPGAFGNDDGLQTVVQYTDPVGLGNSYLFRQYRNGQLNKTIYLQNDKFNDGKHVDQQLRSGNSGPGGNAGGPPPAPIDLLISGDSLTVEMQNVDPGVYQYFSTLNRILQENPASSVTPANPTSNFSGGALGYFSAHSRRVRRIKVP